MLYGCPLYLTLLTRTDAWRWHTPRRALAKEGLAYRQPWAIRYPPGSQLLTPRIFTQRHRPISTTPAQGFEAASLLYQRSQRRFGTPWVGPINAALKRLQLATVVHSRCNLNLVRLFCLSFLLSIFGGRFFLLPNPSYASINLQPPSHTLLYRTPRSSAAMLQSPGMSNTQ